MTPEQNKIKDDFVRSTYPYDCAPKCGRCVVFHANTPCKMHPDFSTEARAADINGSDEGRFTPEWVATVTALREKFAECYE